MGPSRRASTAVNTSQSSARRAFGPQCSHCKRYLISDPAHIACAEPVCNGLVTCIDCFRVGAADEQPHVPSHPYRVIDHINTPIYDAGWSADDELRLLESLCSHGPHHWREVANFVGKTPRQCELHYQRVYVTSPSAPLPTLLSYNETGALAPAQLPFDHPTPPDSGNGSDDEDLDQAFVPDPGSGAQTTLDGYMPLRADLDVEYDDNAEQLVANLSITDADNSEEKDLKIRLLQLYDKRLQRRESFKQALFDRNFLDFSTLKFGQRKNARDEKELAARLQIFSRLLPKKSFDAFYSAVMRNYRASRDLYRLMQYRSLGVKRKLEMDVYEAERKIRESALLDLRKKGGNVLLHESPKSKKPSPIKRRRKSAASEASGSPNPALSGPVQSGSVSGLDGCVSLTGPRTLNNQPLPAPSTLHVRPDDSSNSVALTKVYVPLHQRIGNTPDFQTPQRNLRNVESSAYSGVPLYSACDGQSTGGSGTHAKNIPGLPLRSDEGVTLNITGASRAQVPDAPSNLGRVRRLAVRSTDNDIASTFQPNMPNVSTPTLVPTIPIKLVDHTSNGNGSPTDNNDSAMTGNSPSSVPTASVSPEITERPQTCPSGVGSNAARLARLKKIISRSPYPEVNAMPVADLPDVWKLTRMEQKVCSMLHMAPSEYLQKRDAMLFLASQNAVHNADVPEDSGNDDGAILTLRSDFDSIKSGQPTPSVQSDAHFERSNLCSISSYELPSAQGTDLYSRAYDRGDLLTPTVVNDTDSNCTSKMKSVCDVGTMTSDVTWLQPSTNFTYPGSQVFNTNSVDAPAIVHGPPAFAPFSQDLTVTINPPEEGSKASMVVAGTYSVDGPTDRKTVPLGSTHPVTAIERTNHNFPNHVENPELKNISLHSSSSNDVITNVTLKRYGSFKPPYRHEMGTQIEDFMELGLSASGYDSSAFYSLFTVSHNNEPLTVSCQRDGNEHLELSVSSRSIPLSDHGDQRETYCFGMDSDERDLYRMGKMIVEVDTKAIGIPIQSEDPISFQLREAVRNVNDDRSHAPSVTNEYVLDGSIDTTRSKDPSDTAMVQLTVTCKRKKRYRSFCLPPEQSLIIRTREAVNRGLTEVSFKKAMHSSAILHNVDGVKRFTVVVKSVSVEPPELPEPEAEPEVKLELKTNKAEDVKYVKSEAFIDSHGETLQNSCPGVEPGERVESGHGNAFDKADPATNERMNFPLPARRTKRILESDDDDGSVVLVAITKRNSEITNDNGTEDRSLPCVVHSDMNLNNAITESIEKRNKNSGYNTRQSSHRNHTGNKRDVTDQVPKKVIKKRGRPTTSPCGDVYGDEKCPMFIRLRLKPPMSQAANDRNSGGVDTEATWNTSEYHGIQPPNPMAYNFNPSSMGFAKERNASLKPIESVENMDEEVLAEGRGDRVLLEKPLTGTLFSADDSIFNLAGHTNVKSVEGGFHPADDSDSILILPNSNLSGERPNISHAANNATSAKEIKPISRDMVEVDEHVIDEHQTPGVEKRYSTRKNKRKNNIDEVLRVSKRARRCTLKARALQESDDDVGQDDALLIRPMDENRQNPGESYMEVYVPEPNEKTGSSYTSRERHAPTRYRPVQADEPYQLRKRC